MNVQIVAGYLSKGNEEIGKTIITVARDSVMARKARRILRIEDGVIIASMAPAGGPSQGIDTFYVDMLRARIEKIDGKLSEPGDKFRMRRLKGG